MKNLQGIGCRECRTKQGKENLDEVKKQGNTRELHLELGGDKVTYVRVY